MSIACRALQQVESIAKAMVAATYCKTRKILRNKAVERHDMFGFKHSVLLKTPFTEAMNRVFSACARRCGCERSSSADAMKRIMFNADGSCDPPVEIRTVAQGHGSTHVGMFDIRDIPHAEEIFEEAPFFEQPEKFIMYRPELQRDPAVTQL